MTDKETRDIIDSDFTKLGIPTSGTLTVNQVALRGLYRLLADVGLMGAGGVGTIEAAKVMRAVADTIEKATAYPPLRDVSTDELLLMNTPTDEARH